MAKRNELKTGNMKKFCFFICVLLGAIPAWARRYSSPSTEDWLLALVCLGLFMGIPIIGGLISNWNRERKDQERKIKQFDFMAEELRQKKTQMTNMRNEISALRNKLTLNIRQMETEKRALRTQLEEEYKKEKNTLIVQKNDLEREKEFLEQKNKPLLQACEALSEAFAKEAVSVFDRLRNQFIYKDRPAYTSAEKVAAIKRETKAKLAEYKKYQYIINAYEHMFPWLEDFKEVPLEDAFISPEQADEEERIFSRYLSGQEIKDLTRVEKFQRALDRYTNSWDKTKWQIGLFYERYVGYLYEKEGYKVIMNGAKERWQDMGIDLIASKGKQTQIIQCKYWAQEKTIYEKYIFQLFGTTINYIFEHYGAEINPLDFIRRGRVLPVFITSTQLSKTAHRMSDILGVKVRENFKLEKDYPKIKCNPSSPDGMIYHLPFDQQYDSFQVSQTPGAFYAFTVQEAEDKGYRRAYRWHG